MIIMTVYFAYFIQSREKTFLAGAFITLGVMLFVLAETLIIVCGWTDNLEIGRHLHRAEQIPILFLLVSLPYFLTTAFPSSGFFSRFLRFLMWFGLIAAVAVSAAAYIVPSSLISVAEQSITPILSPGDYTRGLEGPLYLYRDAALGLWIAISLLYSIYYLVKHYRNFQTIMLFFGLILGIIGGIDDLQYIYTSENWILPSLRFSRFILGITLMLLFFLASVFSKYFAAHIKLKATARDLEITEEKYSLLMEAADEVLFSLSEDLKIISVNGKAEKLFGITDGGRSFVDCLYRNEHESAADNQYIGAQLLELREAGKKLSFNTYVKDPVTHEPSEYHFRFDCFEGNNLELIGRAWPTASSKLLEFVEEERLSLQVDNYVVLVGDITDRLTSNLKKFLDEGDVMMIRMGLQEMIINAMEHGNLAVSFDEKTQAQQEDRLFEFMSERRKLPEYRDKSVSIDYFLDNRKVIYRITDMGDGFDYKATMERIRNEVNQHQLSHGRGIVMTQAVFSKVEYNRSGNQVLLVKEFS